MWCHLVANRLACLIRITQYLADVKSILGKTFKFFQVLSWNRAASAIQLVKQLNCIVCVADYKLSWPACMRALLETKLSPGQLSSAIASEIRKLEAHVRYSFDQT